MKGEIVVQETMYWILYNNLLFTLHILFLARFTPYRCISASVNAIQEGLLEF